MKYFTAFLFLCFCSNGLGQDFFIDSQEKTTDFFKKNENISLVEIQQLLYYEYKQLKNLYDVSIQYDSPYLDRLKKENTNPERYISYAELPEVHKYQTLIHLYHEKKEDINYYTYHNTESSSAVLKDMPRYGKFPYQSNIDLRPISAYVNGKENKDKLDFKFYTKIDSLKVLYSYRYPKNIDTIRLKVGALKSNNKYGITLKKYEDYGVEAIVPYNPSIKFLDVAGIDKNGKTLLGNVLDHYNNYDKENDNLIKAIASKYHIVQMLHNEISQNKINSTKEFLSRLEELKKEFGFVSISKSPIITQNILFQIFGNAEEVLIYIQTEEGFISEKLNIPSSKKLHSIFDYYEDETKEWNKPKTYFYDKKKKRKLTNKAYTNIEFLGGNLFKTELGNRHLNEEYKCERILVTKDHKLKKFDNCSGSLKTLSNGGFILEYYDNYGIEQDSVKIFDESGELKFKGTNGVAMNEIFKNSHFIVTSEGEQERFILGNYKITDLLDNYQIYNSHKALIYKGKKCGIIDDFGKELVPTEYTNCYMIGQHHFIAEYKENQVIVNDKNSITHTETQHHLEPITGFEGTFGALTPYINLAVYKENNLYGIKDINGNIIYLPKAEEVFEVGPNRLAIRLENDLIGVINEKGETVIPFQFEAINPFYGGFAMLINENGKKITFYNLEGKIETVHKAEENYEIWNVFSKPTLILDDKIHIRYNGVIFDRAEDN